MLFLRRNLWPICFCSLVALAFFHFSSEKKRALAEVAVRLEAMKTMAQLELQKREELELCLASQNDPAWIEMVLIRDLGVVPEGFLKVHFKR
jgi:hypothetical protein